MTAPAVIDYGVYPGLIAQPRLVPMTSLMRARKAAAAASCASSNSPMATTMPVNSGPTAAQLMPNVVTAVLPGASHFTIPTHNPEQLNDELTRCLS